MPAARTRSAPEIGVLAHERGFLLAPIFAAQLATPEATHRALHPPEKMNAVGGVPDRGLVDGQSGIKSLPHLPADLAVQFAHPVGRTAGLEGEHGHAERLAVILWGTAAEG